MALLRFYKPTKSGGVLFMESLSHAGIVLLLPYLLHVSVPWPHPILQRMAPLVFLSGFTLIHLFFKLASFFATLRSTPSGRLGTFGWLLTSAVFAGAACFMLYDWLKELELIRPEAPSESHVYRVGDQYAMASPMREGTVVGYDFSAGPSTILTLRFANPPDLPEETVPFKKVFVTITLEGREVDRKTYPVLLNASGWSDLVIPADDIPDDVQRCRVVWDFQKPSRWQRLLGVRPVTNSARSLLVSGPLSHDMQGSSDRCNVIVIVLEGLGADHVSFQGYRRKTTPFMEKLSEGSTIFLNAYTPAPDTRAACTSLLTGVSPLRHGVLADTRRTVSDNCISLAELLSGNGYTTAAFTEGEAPEAPDLVYETGIGKGFEIFDPSYPVINESEGDKKAPPSNTVITLSKAQKWIETHLDRDFMVFIRLRELRDPKWQSRYLPGLLSTPESPSAIDVYDSALAYTDRKLGELLKFVRSSEVGNNTCLVVTSSYGLDFSSPENPPIIGLTENSLHIPLLIFSPKGSKNTRAGLVSLVDVLPTVLGLAHISYEGQLEGKNILEEYGQRSAVSLFGSPLVFSLRTDRWRFSWQSGLTPFTWETAAQAGPLELYDVFQAQKRGMRNDVSRQPELVAQYTNQLQNYLNAYRNAP